MATVTLHIINPTAADVTVNGITIRGQNKPHRSIATVDGIPPADLFAFLTAGCAIAPAENETLIVLVSTGYLFITRERFEHWRHALSPELAEALLSIPEDVRPQIGWEF